MKINKKHSIFILIIATQFTIEGVFDYNQSINPENKKTSIVDLIKKWENTSVEREEIEHELNLRVENYNKEKTKEAQQKVWELVQYLNDKAVTEGKNEKLILVPFSKQNETFCFSSITLYQYAENVDISASDIFMLWNSRARLLKSNGILPQGGGPRIQHLEKTSLTKKNTEYKKIAAIIKATYGSGNEFIDVTHIVKKMVGHPFYEFTGGSHSMNAFFGDPTPGIVKNLIIEVIYNDGTSGSLIIQEDDPFTLSYGSEISASPIHKKMIRIVKATYGFEGTFTDVTNTISEMLKKSPYEFASEKKSMNEIFGDPIPGTVKYLTIEVAYNDGTFETLKIRENDNFTLL